MRNCIYYFDRPGLTFDNAEHIIPAGIGGQSTLPKGYVSDQFNNDISKIEMRFMRESILAIGRQLVGPGKRGSTKPKEATRSSVMLVSQPGPPETFFLGYLSLGDAVSMPQIRVNQLTGEVDWSLPAGFTAESAGPYLVERLEAISTLKTRYILDDRLPENVVIIAFDDQLYIARSKSSKFELSAAIAAGLQASIESWTGPYEQKHQPISFNQVAIVADDFYRVTAKIALNTLALLKGKEFVLHTAFDLLRRYITNAGANPGVVFIPKPQRMPQFPTDAHNLMFAASGGKLAANVCFYDQFTVNVILATNYTGDFQPEIYLCDWLNKQEGLL